MPYVTTLQSPIGRLVIEGDDDAINHITLPRPQAANNIAARKVGGGRVPRPVSQAIEQLDEYFAGERRDFDLPLVLEGTGFQKDVWMALADIPYGATVSYAELAEMVGRPKAARAVGQANGANPLPVVLPCHRVLASGGKIGGYGGGLMTKRTLLALEGVVID